MNSPDAAVDQWVRRARRDGAAAADEAELRGPLGVGVADFCESVTGDISWLVKDYVAAGAWTLVSGPPKKGKTWFLAWLAASVASSGHRVVFVEEEGADVILKKRLLPFIQPNPRSYNDCLRVVFRKGLRLDNMESVRRLADECEGAAMVMLDPLACLHQIDENEQVGMSKIMAAVQGLITATGAAVVLAHHTAKNKWSADVDADTGDSRGSGVLGGAVDIAISLKGVRGAELQPGEIRFRVDNTDSRMDACCGPRVGSILLSGGVAAVTWEEVGPSARAAQEGPEGLLERVLVVTPFAPNGIDRDALRKALAVGPNRLSTATKLGLADGRLIRCGYHSGFSRPVKLKVVTKDE